MYFFGPVRAIPAAVVCINQVVVNRLRQATTCINARTILVRDFKSEFQFRILSQDFKAGLFWGHERRMKSNFKHVRKLSQVGQSESLTVIG